MKKNRWFPWLGFRTLDEDDLEFYELSDDYEYTAFTFEWGSLYFLIFAWGYLKEDNNDNVD